MICILYYLNDNKYALKMYPNEGFDIFCPIYMLTNMLSDAFKWREWYVSYYLNDNKHDLKIYSNEEFCMFCKSLMISNIILKYVQMNSFDDNKYALNIYPNE